MGVHNNDGAGEDMKWTEKNEDAFVAILYERVRKDPNATPSFKLVDRNKMDDELFLATGKKYGAEKRPGKYNRLRIKHRQFSELISHTGVTYNSSSNQVIAAEEVWQMFKKKHKNYMAFKSKGCQNYEMLGQIFNKSTATRPRHHASIQLRPNSREERENEEEFLSRGLHGTEGQKSVIGSSTEKRPFVDFDIGCWCVKKDSKFEKFETFLEMLQFSLSAKAERQVAKTKRYKEMPNKATSPVSNPYSIQECMDILNNLNDVSEASYLKAGEMFTNPDCSVIFVKMPILRKKSWLKSLE
ncbi:Myb/SANT-like domain [Dillenia turbinata]|uniref:Myb/SANT-like domain n=1 Tax=Dillenia turbinata TaxID=194707 RepID=A0AAN8VWS2_9MAGN